MKPPYCVFFPLDALFYRIERFVFSISLPVYLFYFFVVAQNEGTESLAIVAVSTRKNITGTRTSNYTSLSNVGRYC